MSRALLSLVLVAARPGPWAARRRRRRARRSHGADLHRASRAGPDRHSGLGHRRTVVLYNVQECLVKVDRHGKLVPWLAERWHTTDEKNYTFFLKRGVRFHNGRELKAADVKFADRAGHEPRDQASLSPYYEAIGDIVVKDDYTVSFALKNPTPNFLLNMARQGSVIYPREAVDTLEERPGGDRPLHAWPSGCAGDRIVLAKQPGLPRARGCPSSIG